MTVGSEGSRATSAQRYSSISRSRRSGSPSRLADVFGRWWCAPLTAGVVRRSVEPTRPDPLAELHGAVAGALERAADAIRSNEEQLLLGRRRLDQLAASASDGSVVDLTALEERTNSAAARRSS